VELIARWSWTLALAGMVLVAGGLSGWYAAGYRWVGAPTWLAVAGALLLLAYPILDRQRVAATVTTRGFQLGSGSSLLVMLAAGLSAGLYLLAERNDHTFDLTTDGQHSLSAQSARVAEQLDQPVEVLAFFSKGSAGARAFQPMIGLFEERTDQLQVQHVDPLRSPRLAERHEIVGDHGTVVLLSGDKEQRLDWPFDEEQLTERLLMLQSDVTHVICWSVGHGEPDPDDEFTEGGLGAVVTELEALNYEVRKLPVATQGVERACEALVVARPTEDWLPYEREALAAYLAEGGRVVVLLDPGIAPELAAELDRYGVVVGDDLVFDVNPNNQLMGIQDPSVVVLTGRNLLSHAITADLGAAVVLPMARSVSPAPDREGLSVRALLQTSADAWGERSYDQADVGPNPGEELIGDVPVAALVEIEDPEVLEVAASTAAAPREADVEVDLAPDAPDAPDARDLPDAPDPVEAGDPPPPAQPPGAPAVVQALQGDVGRAVPADLAPVPGGRLVVVGDSDFASNVNLLAGNNRDLMLNIVAWLVDEEAQLGERPEAGDTLEITTVGEAMLCLVSVIFVPGAVLLLALATFLRRRRL